MATLAIRGHATRGKEVIEILEMLGGENVYFLNGSNLLYNYHIHKGRIVCTESRDLMIFTLEGFLKKFPYKVGDKVLPMYYSHPVPRVITRMMWNDNEVCYYTENKGGEFTANELQPYIELREETTNEALVIFW